MRHEGVISAMVTTLLDLNIGASSSFAGGAAVSSPLLWVVLPPLLLLVGLAGRAVGAILLFLPSRGWGQPPSWRRATNKRKKEGDGRPTPTQRRKEKEGQSESQTKHQEGRPNETSRKKVHLPPLMEVLPLPPPPFGGAAFSSLLWRGACSSSCNAVLVFPPSGRCWLFKVNSCVFQLVLLWVVLLSPPPTSGQCSCPPSFGQCAVLSLPPRYGGAFLLPLPFWAVPPFSSSFGWYGERK